ncbi:MAG: hypothetical protein JO112_07605, partial [Planctomycetes bacterium]|nr:hypothetical protein [Planctomycetota bacterium]
MARTVLFSREDLAAFIDRNFEPVWQTVRPVPLVRIDFGNGTVVTRTLHGNIATYVCTSEGQVLDILPGIYTPGAYLERLNQLHLLARYVDQVDRGQSPAQRLSALRNQGGDLLPTKEVSAHRAERLRDYHRHEAEALRQKLPPSRLVAMMVGPITKMYIESRTEVLLIPGGPAQAAVPA